MAIVVGRRWAATYYYFPFGTNTTAKGELDMKI